MVSIPTGWPFSLMRRPCLRNSPVFGSNSNEPKHSIRGLFASPPVIIGPTSSVQQCITSRHNASRVNGMPCQQDFRRRALRGRPESAMVSDMSAYAGVTDRRPERESWTRRNELRERSNLNFLMAVGGNKMKPILSISLGLALASSVALADVITDWNLALIKATETAPLTPAPITTRVAAIVQAAV